MLNKITNLPENAVVFDTETTGFDPESGDRIVEIGAVEMVGGLPTKNKFHVYINPNRSVPQEAVNVHGLTGEFLSQFNPIEDVISSFIEFVGDLPMIAHNAQFDSKFINFELMAMGMSPYAEDRYLDSLSVARKLYPGSPANLDALCRRHNISLTSRENHGALIDSELLAEVIVEMGGGRQTSLFDDTKDSVKVSASNPKIRAVVDTFVRNASIAEISAHQQLVAKLGENAIWNKIPT
jgi:DNA polymerase-3 subunit epsilon